MMTDFLRNLNELQLTVLCLVAYIVCIHFAHSLIVIDTLILKNLFGMFWNDRISEFGFVSKDILFRIRQSEKETRCRTKIETDILISIDCLFPQRGISFFHIFPSLLIFYPFIALHCLCR